MNYETKHVFVTVGTTSFDKLIKTVLSKEILKILTQLGYTNLKIQLGNYSEESPTISDKKLKIEFYKFKDSILDDIRQADFVISHAGAGSCLEILGENKSLLVVVNEDLMGNHQTELADQLYEDGHVFKCICSTLYETLESMDLTKLEPLPPANTQCFIEYLNSIMQLS